MDLKDKNVWQHAAGNPEHDHADKCLNYDVIISGADTSGILRDDMKEGDVVVLKVGLSRVRGVGLLGDYVDLGEEGAFGDLDGWTLPHARRVSWLWKGDQPLEGRPLTRTTTQRLWKEPVLECLSELESNQTPTGSYAELPKAGRSVSRNDIADYLFGRGVGSDSIRSLLDPDGEFMGMVKWYDGWEWHHSPSEHETVAHLVVPFLRILGWTPPRIALEYGRDGRADVALLSGLTRQNKTVPRDGAQAVAVLEAKKVRRACLSWAASQVINYARQHEVMRAIATDGLRYGVFWRSNADADFKLGAYLNLIRPRDKYAIYGCLGAAEAIWAMTPDWQPEP